MNDKIARATMVLSRIEAAQEIIRATSCFNMSPDSIDQYSDVCIKLERLRALLLRDLKACK